MDECRYTLASTLIGRRFGNYYLLRLLGEGGNAAVYLGSHKYLDTFAAIKVPYRRMTGDELMQFCKEARIIAHLRHPNIIRILEFAVDDGIPFLVMEYARRGTLRQRHQRSEAVQLNTVIYYVKQVASALQYMHDHGFIHQDVKPDNMLIAHNGKIQISDFGIAIAVTRENENDQQPIGTMPYMAPEQILGHPCFATDQYALAAVVYEWICGNPPFQGDAQQVAQQHLTKLPTPLHVVCPSLPQKVEQVVLKALSKEPEQRFSSIQEFAMQLEKAYQCAVKTQQPPHDIAESSLQQRGEKEIPMRKLRFFQQRRNRRQINTLRDITSLFVVDLILGGAVFVVLSLLGFQTPTLLFFTLLCLIACPILGAAYLREGGALLYIGTILIVAAFVGVLFHSQALFAVIYIGCLLIGTIILFSLSIRDD